MSTPIDIVREVKSLVEPSFGNLSLPGCGHARLAELEVLLSHDQYEPVHGRVALWEEVVEILKANPVLRTTLIIPNAAGDGGFIEEQNALEVYPNGLVETTKTSIEKHRHQTLLPQLLVLYFGDRGPQEIADDHPIFYNTGLDKPGVIQALNNGDDDGIVYNGICDALELSLKVRNYSASQNILYESDMEGFCCGMEDLLREHSAQLASVLGLNSDQFEEMMEERTSICEIDGWINLLRDVVQVIQQGVQRRWQKVRNHVRERRIFFYWRELTARNGTRERDRVIACEEYENEFSFVEY